MKSTNYKIIIISILTIFILNILVLISFNKEEVLTRDIISEKQQMIENNKFVQKVNAEKEELEEENPNNFAKFTEEEELLFKINELCNLAAEFKKGNISNSSELELCLQYIRRNRYFDGAWKYTAGTINNEFVEYVASNNTELTNYNFNPVTIIDPITGYAIDFTHMCATLNAIVYSKKTAFAKVIPELPEFAGWAGDLTTFMEEIINFDDGEKDLIKEAKDKLGTDAKSTFDICDMLADIDAVNIYNYFSNNNLYEAITEYYYDSNDYIKNRKEFFVNDYLGGKDNIINKVIDTFQSETGKLCVKGGEIFNVAISGILKDETKTKYNGNEDKYIDVVAQAFSDYFNSNDDIKVEANTLTYNSQSQCLVTAINSQGDVYYSIEVELTADNYEDKGSTIIPKGTNAGEYTVYYYTPGNENYEEKRANANVIINAYNLENASIEEVEAQIYTGGEIKPEPKVTVPIPSENNKTTLVNGTDFEYSYYDNNEAGKTATITITGKGNYTGTKTATFTIIEKLKVELATYQTKEGEEETYIREIKPGTTIEELENNITTNGAIEIYENREKVTEQTAKIKTGMTVKITLNEEELEYTLVVIGDITGNGNIGGGDILKLARYIAGLDTDLKGAFYEASDVYKDGIYAQSSDVLKMARVMAGLDEL